MNVLPFVKMEGAGNDYVYVDGLQHAIPDLDDAETWGRRARRLADRHFGIGADGLILVLPASEAGAAARMWMFNADGSEGRTCGNGLRCVAKLLFDRGHAESPMRIQTAAGTVRAEVVSADEHAGALEIAVGMGVPRVGAERTIVTHAGSVTFVPVELGNPHAVVFVEDVESSPVEEIGRALQRHDSFPDSVNVEFVQIDARGDLLQRTFERGSGETLACGSGAVAAVAAALRRSGRFGVRRVRLWGGDVSVRWAALEEPAVLRGPAREVFQGVVDVSEDEVRPANA